MLTSTKDKCVEQRYIVDMVMIKFLIINPNNLFFRNVYCIRVVQVAEGRKTIYFYYPLIPGNLEQDPAIFLKPDQLNNKDVPIDNSHPKEMMVKKMAREIEALTGIFGSIQLVANNQNVRFTNIFLTKVNVTAICFLI